MQSLRYESNGREAPQGLRTELTQEQWDRCFGKTPKDKMVSLVELIEAAKKRQQEDS
jgi:hypothetical protein